MKKMTMGIAALITAWGLILSLPAQAQNLTAQEQGALIVLQSQVDAAETTEQRAQIVADAVSTYPNLVRTSAVREIAINNNFSVSSNGVEYITNTTIDSPFVQGEKISFPAEAYAEGSGNFSSSAINPDFAVAALAERLLANDLSEDEQKTLIDETINLIASTTNGRETANSFSKSLVDLLKNQNAASSVIVAAADTINTSDKVTVTVFSGINPGDANSFSGAIGNTDGRPS
ncbi:MAG: hypothetical protein AAGI24_01180 [Pseudomonadota bacterium]